MAGEWTNNTADAGRRGVNWERSWRGPRLFSQTFVADAAAATVPDVQIVPAGFSGYLIRVEVIMGAPAPANGVTDLTIENEDGIDLLGGEGLNMTTTADQVFTPTTAGTYGPAPYITGLTCTISNNTTNSATATVKVFVEMEE